MDVFRVIDSQNKNEWLKARRWGIGGSDASAIIGMNPYKTNTDLYDEKVALKEPADISDKPYVQYGIRAEKPIRELFQLDYPEYTVEHHENQILQNLQYPFMQASLDGELTDAQGRKGILEIKTANILQGSQRAKWKERIPDTYYIQLLHYFLVTGYAFAVLRAHLISSRGTDVSTQVKHYFIERSEVKEDLIFLQQAEIAFWERIQKWQRPDLLLPAI